MSKSSLYTCPIEGCAKAYTRPCLVEQHRRSHTDERPYVCTVCNKGFLRAAHLKTHTFSHNSVKPFSCKFCSKGFSTNQQLSRHLRTHKDADPKAVLPLLSKDPKITIENYEYSESLYSEFNAIMSLPDHPMFSEATDVFGEFGSSSTSDSASVSDPTSTSSSFSTNPSNPSSYGVSLDPESFAFLPLEADLNAEPAKDFVPREWACREPGCEGVMVFDSLGELVLHCDQAHHDVPVALHSLYDDIAFPPLFLPAPLGIEDLDTFYSPEAGCPVQRLLAGHTCE